MTNSDDMQPRQTPPADEDEPMGAHTMDEADHDADMMGDAPGESDMVPEPGTDTGMMGHESQ